MPKPSAMRTVSCPSCGAPADLAPETRVGKCKYCGATIERVDAPPPPPAPAPTPTVERQPNRPPVVYVTTTQIATPTRQTNKGGGACLGIMLPMLVLVFVGAGVFFLWSGNDLTQLLNLPSNLSGIIPSSLIANGTFRLIPPANDGAPDLAGGVYDITSEKYSLAYLSGGAKPALQWQAAARKEFPNPFVVAANADYIYTANDTRVLALNRGDGTVAWEGSLTDALPYCEEGCWQLVGDRLVALTKDGTLQAFNAETGKQAWSMELESTPDRFWVAFDQLLVLVRVDAEVHVLFIDPRTGEVNQQLTPHCPENGDSFASGLDTYSPVVADEANDALYFAYGFPDTCVQRWEVTDGELQWETQLEADSFIDLREARPLLTAKAMYFGNGTQLFAVDLATGDLEVLLEEEDFEFVPLALEDDLLLVRATNSRGTEKLELRGIDLATGEQAWVFALGTAQPLDPPEAMTSLVSEGETVWTWHLTSAGFTLVQIHASPHEIRLTTLDPVEGVSTGEEKVIPIYTNSTISFLSPPQVIGWVKDTLWLVLESHVYAVDTAAGTATLWP